MAASLNLPMSTTPRLGPPRPQHLDVPASLDDLAAELDRTDRSIQVLLALALGAALAMALLALASQIV